MGENHKEQGKKCFIITPIGNEKSDTFRRAKGVIESVIKPVLQKYGFNDIKPAYEMSVSGMITTQIINRIIEDDLVVTNLTGNNPNVMYELCLRHVVAKPIIHICESGTELPFDIKDNRTIFYTNDMLGVDELKEIMSGFMDEINYQSEYRDNPIYNAYRLGNLLKKSGVDGKEGESEVIEEILNILSEIKDNNYSYRPELIASNEYTDDDFFNEVRSITAKDIAEVEKINNAIRVHELAKQLRVTNRTVLRIAKTVDIQIKSQMSSLNVNQLKKIIDFLLAFKAY